MSVTNSLPILQKILNTSRNDASKQIMDHHKEKGYTVVSFLYFANAMKLRLFEKQNQQQKKYNAAMLQADFILPDGIAIEVFYAIASRFNKILSSRRPTNLNGTDFIPYFLKKVMKKDPNNFHIALYHTYDPVINKGKEYVEYAKENFQKQFYNKAIDFSFAHNYRDSEENKAFPFEKYQQSLNETKAQYKLFIVGLGTPKQEVRTEKHKSFFEKNWILVFNAWWLMDFISWYEKRAPERAIKWRIFEALYRLAKNPKKNKNKVLAMFGVGRFLAKKLLFRK